MRGAGKKHAFLRALNPKAIAYAQAAIFRALDIFTALSYAASIPQIKKNNHGVRGDGLQGLC